MMKETEGGNNCSKKTHDFISEHDYAGLWDRVREDVGEYNPRVLREYAPSSKEVYGEVNPALVNDIIREVELTREDVFYDLGSGVGNVVLQVAAQVGCKAVGVEIRPELHRIALRMRERTMQLLQQAERSPQRDGEEAQVDGGDITASQPQRYHCGEVQLLCGDLSNPTFDLSEATVVFLNNFCFPEELEQAVLHKFKRMLRDGARVVSTKSFGPRFRPFSGRSNDDPCHIFRFPWRTRKSSVDAVSWTAKSIEYYIYVIDREHRNKIGKAKKDNKQEARDTIFNIFGGSEMFTEEHLSAMLEKHNYDVPTCVEKLMLLTLANYNTPKNAADSPRETVTRKKRNSTKTTREGGERGEATKKERKRPSLSTRQRDRKKSANGEEGKRAKANEAPSKEGKKPKDNTQNKQRQNERRSRKSTERASILSFLSATFPDVPTDILMKVIAENEDDLNASIDKVLRMMAQKSSRLERKKKRDSTERRSLDSTEVDAAEQTSEKGDASSRHSSRLSSQKERNEDNNTTQDQQIDNEPTPSGSNEATSKKRKATASKRSAVPFPEVSTKRSRTSLSSSSSSPTTTIQCKTKNEQADDRDEGDKEQEGTKVAGEKHPRYAAMEKLALLYPGVAPDVIMKFLVESNDSLSDADRKLKRWQKNNKTNDGFEDKDDEGNKADSTSKSPTVKKRIAKRKKTGKQQQQKQEPSTLLTATTESTTKAPAIEGVVAEEVKQKKDDTDQARKKNGEKAKQPEQSENEEIVENARRTEAAHYFYFDLGDDFFSADQLFDISELEEPQSIPTQRKASDNLLIENEEAKGEQEAQEVDDDGIEEIEVDGLIIRNDTTDMAESLLLTADNAQTAEPEEHKEEAEPKTAHSPSTSTTKKRRSRAAPSSSPSSTTKTKTRAKSRTRIKSSSTLTAKSINEMAAQLKAIFPEETEIAILKLLQANGHDLDLTTVHLLERAEQRKKREERSLKRKGIPVAIIEANQQQQSANQTNTSTAPSSTTTATTVPTNKRKKNSDRSSSKSEGRGDRDGSRKMTREEVEEEVEDKKKRSGKKKRKTEAQMEAKKQRAKRTERKTKTNNDEQTGDYQKETNGETEVVEPEIKDKATEAAASTEVEETNRNAEQANEKRGRRKGGTNEETTILTEAETTTSKETNKSDEPEVIEKRRKVTRRITRSQSKGKESITPPSTSSSSSLASSAPSSTTPSTLLIPTFSSPPPTLSTFSPTTQTSTTTPTIPAALTSTTTTFSTPSSASSSPSRSTARTTTAPSRVAASRTRTRSQTKQQQRQQQQTESEQAAP
ncbi:Histone-lysine N-methyltransferase, H3 lysine-79 specific [Balamuthia mandrillaris]